MTKTKTPTRWILVRQRCYFPGGCTAFLEARGKTTAGATLALQGELAKYRWEWIGDNLLCPYCAAMTEALT